MINSSVTHGRYIDGSARILGDPPVELREFLVVPVPHQAIDSRREGAILGKPPGEESVVREFVEERDP